MPLEDNIVSNVGEAVKQPKIKHSTFLVTVNSNKRRYSDDYMSKFKSIMGILFQDGGNGLIPYIEQGKYKDPDYLSKIESISIDGAFENLTEDGNEITKLHLHVIVNITHRTSISINYNALKKDIGQVLPGAYVNAKYMDRDIVSIEEYVHKYDKLADKLDVPKIGIDPSAPTFHDFLRSNGITPSNVKSNMSNKMDKSILGQILEREGIDKKQMIFKIASKNGLDTKDYEKALDKVIELDKRITDEEIMVFLEM